jgi:hypothetical protein
MAEQADLTGKVEGDFAVLFTTQARRTAPLLPRCPTWQKHGIFKTISLSPSGKAKHVRQITSGDLG